jgi:hypothetical protein
MDLYLNEQHDLNLVDGDLETVTDYQEIKQAIRVTLLTQVGEWLFDLLFGVPYREQILIKSPDLNAVLARFRTILANIDGITAIIQLALTEDQQSRKVTLSGQVDTREGKIDLDQPIV